MGAAQEVKAMAVAHGLEFKDCGEGHLQIKGHGALVNYYPESKRQTAFRQHPGKKKASIPYATPWDAVSLCLDGAHGEVKPKRKRSKNGPDFNVKPVRTNPAGIRHFYQGETPPWEFPTFICSASDKMRITATRLRDRADAMDCAGAEAIQEAHNAE